MVGVKRIHSRLFRIADQLSELEIEASALIEELDMHRSIDEDAQRDAALGNYIDREEAGLTSSDVARFERSLDSIEKRRQKLLERRDKLMAKLEGST